MARLLEIRIIDSPMSSAPTRSITLRRRSDDSSLEQATRESL